MRNIKCDKAYQQRQKELNLLHKRKKYFEKVNIKYNFNFDYSNSILIDGETLFSVRCKKHNITFDVKPRLHLHRGSGCTKCSTISRQQSKLKNTKSFVKKAKKIFGNKFDYSMTKYTHSDNQVKIRCIEHDYIFSQMARSHLQGNMGCSLCSNNSRGFNANKSAILYYLSINNGQAYKIGITHLTVEERYASKDLSKIKIINIINYKYGIDALHAEQEILKRYKEFKYTGKDLLKSGNTELFNIDILELDD